MQNKFCLKAPSKTYKNLSHTKFKLFLLAAQIASANSQLRLLALSASRSNALLGLRRKMAAQRAKASLGRCQQTYSFYRTCVLFHIRIFMHSLCRRWSCVQFGVNVSYSMTWVARVFKRIHRKLLSPTVIAQMAISPAATCFPPSLKLSTAASRALRFLLLQANQSTVKLRCKTSHKLPHLLDQAEALLFLYETVLWAFDKK